MNKLKMSQKLWGMLVFALIGVTSISVLGLDRLYDNLLEDRKIKVQSVVETAHSLISQKVALVTSGEISESEGKKQALDIISKLRYEETNYFWINDMQANMVMHPIKPQLNGKDLSKSKDPNGTALFANMVSVVRASGEGFVPYIWPKPGLDKPVAKLSFVKGLDEWGWMVGSGIYIDDVDKVYYGEVRSQGTILLIMTAFMTAIMLLMNKSIRTPLQAAAKAADAIASGHFDNNIPKLQSRDELAVMMASLDTMQIALRDQIDQDHKKAIEIGRIKQALDNVETNVIVTDADEHIIYANKSFFSALQRAKGSHLAVTTSNLIGSRLDALMGSSTAYYADGSPGRRVCIGDLTFRALTGPVMDEAGTLIGTVTELIDRTEQLEVENEVQDIVSGAQAGDLSVRVDLTGKAGFFLRLSESINKLVEVNEHAIADTVEVLSALAKGDLSKRINTSYQGAFNELKLNTNQTASQLTEIIRKIQATSDALLANSQEISEGNMDLSRRTESQSANLQQSASNMKKITETVSKNAENAHHAAELAHEARELAEKGGEVADLTINAMSGINCSSKRISNIISVIDEIAFQTNLLALNAAVEAAHAGEDGRGFAVVATEVRDLAGRSSDASKEIKGLIKTSVTEVDNGSALVDQSGDSLKKILKSVSKVNDIILDISNANQEQSIGIAQINTALSQMDGMTQQNAALVEKVAVSSGALQQQAGELQNLISFFKLGESTESYKTPTFRTTPTQQAQEKELWGQALS